MCGVLLIIARVLRLGFIGDFLSASVLIGFLTGVGIQVATGQIPDLLGVPKGSGNWFQQQWAWMTSLGEVSWPTVAYGAATIGIILGFKYLLPKVPGAIIAVVGLLTIATVTDATSYGVDVIGAIQGGLPPIGLPQGVTWSDIPGVLSTAFACFFIVIAQSAATSRGFAAKHGDRADVNRDIIGLSAANLAAGLSGTFVVNGSPTKTQILDGDKGRTQVANLVVVAVTLVVLLFLTDLLTDLPKAVLGGVVFVIGLELIDIKGLVRVSRQRRRELFIAIVTAFTVFVVGVGAGVVLALVLSLLDVIERQYNARDFVCASARGRATRTTRRYPACSPSPGSSSSATTPSSSTRTPRGSSTRSRGSSPTRPTRCSGSSSTARGSPTSTIRPLRISRRSSIGSTPATSSSSWRAPSRTSSRRSRLRPARSVPRRGLRRPRQGRASVPRGTLPVLTRSGGGCLGPGRPAALRALVRQLEGAHGMPRDPRRRVVEPAQLGLGGEDHRVDDERAREVLGAVVGIVDGPGSAAPGGAPRDAARCGADHVGHLDAGKRRGDGQLEGQLVASRGAALDGGVEPAAHVRPAGIRDPPVHVPLLVGVALLGEAVALEAVEGVVDLADVERPRAAGATREFGPQLIAVARAPGRGSRAGSGAPSWDLLLHTGYALVSLCRPGAGAGCLAALPWAAPAGDVRHGILSTLQVTDG